MKFGKWDINENADSISNRITKAGSAECTPLGILKDIGYAVFSGRHGIYNTTLDACNCFDFAGFSLPCKHILRLAMEMGLVEHKYESDLDSVKYPQKMSFVEKVVYVDTATGEATSERPLPEGPLNDLTFVITGVFEVYTRDDIINLIRRAGGKISSSVSRKTSFLVAGKDAGSKLAKANEYGVTIISDSELVQMIG